MTKEKVERVLISVTEGEQEQLAAIQRVTNENRSGLIRRLVDAEAARLVNAKPEYSPAELKALRQIVTTGACAITPPIIGFLVRNEIITPNGFDTVKAQAILDGAK